MKVIEDGIGRQPSRPLGGTVLITGATGFIGACLARDFLAKGNNVVAVGGPSDRGSWRRGAYPGAKFLQVDLSIEAQVQRLVVETRPTVVIHCAAYGAYSTQSDPRRIYQVNLEALRLLLEAFRGDPNLKAFIQMGTSSEYGFNCKAPEETTPVLPDSDYAVSKVAATALTQFYARKHGVPAWVFRLYSVYGPYEEPSRLIPRLLLNVIDRKLPPLVAPTISRDFIHVDDVSRACQCLIQRAAQLEHGGLFNIGTGIRTTLEDLVANVRRTFALDVEPVWGSMQNRHWDHPEWYSDPRKAKRELGWAAATSLTDGLRSTLEWMECNQEVLTAGLVNGLPRDDGPSPAPGISPGARRAA